MTRSIGIAFVGAGIVAEMHGRGVAEIGDVEGWQDAPDTLVLLRFDLLGGFLLLGLLCAG